jgi:hypothetical protein
MTPAKAMWGQDNLWGIHSASRENRDCEGRKPSPAKLVLRGIIRAFFCKMPLTLLTKRSIIIQSFGQRRCSLLKISLVLKAGAFLYVHNL